MGRSRLIFRKCIAILLVVSVATPVLLVPEKARAATTVIFLTTTGSNNWSVPADWNDSSNTIEVIGGGGSGCDVAAVSDGCGGGGGGGYSRISNVNLPEGQNVTYSVGTGGSAEATGGDTWLCNSTSNCASIGGTAVVVGAEGGNGTGSATGGAGGTVTTAVGDVTRIGGTGGDGGSTTNDGGGGGGGAGGPDAAGEDGGNGSISGGGGGGGGAGGTLSTVGGNAPNGTGASGGDGPDGTGGGTPGNPGNPGTTGTGGGGGGGTNSFSLDRTGGAGAMYNEWVQTSDSADAGPGGGGGGGGCGGAGNGGNAGSYGGGGGGACEDGNNGGDGAQGIIVITYTPAGSVTVPGVETNAANAGETSAILYGNITSTGNETGAGTNHGFAYSTSSSLSTNVTTTTLSTYEAEGSFSELVGGLEEHTVYYVRAYAVNSVGTSTGAILNFTAGRSSAVRHMRIFEGFRFVLHAGSRLVLYQKDDPPVTVDVGDSFVDTTNLAGSGSWNFTNVDLGAAAADRTLVLQIVGGFNTDGTNGPPTVDGNPMQLVYDSTPGDLIFQLWALPYPSGTTATVNVPWGSGSGTLLRFAGTMYSVYGLKSLTPRDTFYLGGGSGTSHNIDIGVLKDGITFVSGRAGVNNSFTWSDDDADTTINETFDQFIEATVSHTMGYILGTKDVGSLTATFTWTDSTSSLVNGFGVTLR